MQQPQRLEHGPDADLVVHARGGGQAVAQVAHAQGERHRVAGADELLGLRLVLGADVHPDVGEHRHLGPLLGGQQVSRPAGDDAGDRPLARPDGQVLAEQNLHVPAADRLDVEEAVLVDVLDHQRDLVAVAGQHDPVAGVGRLSFG